MSQSGSDPSILCGQDGQGKFSEINVGSLDVCNDATNTALSALEHIPFRAGEAGVPFCICDYGTADGGASLSLITQCIKWIKAHYGLDQQVSVVYEDQPGNDFRSLFSKVQGISPGSSTYYQEYRGVFVSAVGTSFYTQCVPTNSVHLAFSSSAFHWLSKRPTLLEDSNFYLYSKDQPKRQLFADQAASDWEVILLNRAEELKSGGRFIINCLCLDTNGYFACGKTPYASRVLFDELLECWNDMEGEGKISKVEKQTAQFDTYLRTEDEFRAPFQPGRPVYETGLRMVSYRTQILRCPFHLKWIEKGKKDDVQAARNHAEQLVGAVRSWSSSTFIMALEKSRSKNDKDKIINGLYSKLVERITASPEDYSQDTVHAYIDIEKI